MLDITREYFLTVAGAALVVGLVVQLVKMWLVQFEGLYWHDPAVTTVAFLLGFVASLVAYYANYIVIDGPTVAFLLLQGVIIGALASGGFEWVKNIAAFVSGARGDNA